MELRDYLNVIRARRGIIIASMLIVAITAVAVSLLQQPTYESTAKVLVSQNDQTAAILGNVLPQLATQPDRVIQTEVQLIEIRPVVESTIRELNLGIGAAELSKHVIVTAQTSANLITVKVDWSNPRDASRIANSIASQYVAWSQELQRRYIKQAADEVQRRLNVAQAQILALGQKIQSSGKSDELSAELQLATGTYTTLAEKLEQLRINEQLSSGNGAVVEPAVPNSTPVAPKPLRNGALGLAVGLVFGLGMAFLSEYLDNTIKSTDEAERTYSAPVLGTIPVDAIEKSGPTRRLVISEAPGSATAEAYRVLRNSLDFINFQNDMRTLVVTSAAPGEGKSTVAANLAAALANAGKKVVLVGTDFRKPTLFQFFKVDNQIGLSDVLLGTHSLKSALQRPTDTQLLVLTAGKMPPNPSELLASTKMQDVIKSLEEWGDWIIIDSPPLLAVADPAAVARWAQGVLMVSKAGFSTRDAARKAAELLDKAGARLVGVVVWGLEESQRGRGYGYGYDYYNTSYYYYSNYYHSGEAGKGGRKKKGSSKSGNGAQSEVAGTPPASGADTDWVPERSPGQRAASVVGRIFVGVLAFLVIIAIAALVTYFLASYYDPGLLKQLSGIL